MPYLLDTNTCIAYLNRSSQSIYDYLADSSPEDVFVCDVVRYELYYGAYKSARTEKNLKILQVLSEEFISLLFDEEAAEICGKIRADLESKGTPIGAYDLQIAAIALANNLTLVTHNTQEFQRVPDLLLTDWL